MPNEGNFDSKVTTAYQDVTASGGYVSSRKTGYADGKYPTTRVKANITVSWDGNSYTATGLVSSGTR